LSWNLGLRILLITYKQMQHNNAADVNKLRTATGAGMMDCKALVEADGDFDLIENLRKKRQK
jgi:elongation factor Ts